MKKIKILLIGLLATFSVFLLLTGCTGRADLPKKADWPFKEVVIIEKGSIDGAFYMMFRDTRTDRRIFHWNGAMVVLPEDKE